MRVLLFTGKGGVGKTTTAAATALHLADAGLRVVLTSADPAHSLSDSLGVELDSVPREVAPRCHAQQLDARARLEENWGAIQQWLVQVFEWAGVEGLEAEELAVLPGLDELFALTEIESLHRSGDYDVVVVDCAPTAETIRLLSLPDLIGWYMERLFPASRRVTRMVAPIVSRMSALPVADESVFSAGQEFYERLEAVRRILCDPVTTSVRLVLTPERMVIAEARRTYTYLSLFGYQVDGVVVNRVLPEVVDDPWFKDWHEQQAEHLATIDSAFEPLRIFRAGHVGGEVTGIGPLRAFAQDLWRDTDPQECLTAGRPLRVERDGDGYVLSIELPFATSDEVELSQLDDELLVTVGPHRRNLMLPDSLRRRTVESAEVRDHALNVRFV